jgi:hypothetical protein
MAIEAKIAQWQQLYGTPKYEGEPKTLATLKVEWVKEDGVMTAEQVQTERHFWEEFHRNRESVCL